MINIKNILLLLTIFAFAVSCDDDDATDGGTTPPQELDFSGSFTTADQMGRPAINTVFVPTGMEDAFNVTLPADQGAAFQETFENTLLFLNPGYTTNALGTDFTATGFTTALATDVLTVSLDGPTSFGTLTGRALSDDVITTELTLIFGGPDGTANPGFSDDNVDANDLPFLTSFPYLAAPHQ